MERFVIYGLVDPRNDQLRYVGKSTTGAKQRLASHLCPSSLKEQTRKNGWLKGLLKKSLRPEVITIEVCEGKADLNEAERHHIAAFRALGCNLTNATPGGDGEGWPCSEEKRAKLSAATKGRRLSVLTSETYARIGLKARGRKRSPESIAKTASKNKGQKRSPEQLQRFSEVSRLKWAEPGYVEKMARAHGGRPFVDQHGRRYETQQGAARQLVLSAGHINQVLQGKRRSAGGLVFTFIKEH